MRAPRWIRDARRAEARFGRPPVVDWIARCANIVPEAPTFSFSQPSGTGPAGKQRVCGSRLEEASAGVEVVAFYRDARMAAS